MLDRPHQKAIFRLLAESEWTLAMLVGVATCLVFFPAVACDFVNWDDDSYVYENPVVSAGLSWQTCGEAFRRVVCHNWAPFTILSYLVDTSCFGMRPAGFHLTNVLLHSLASAALCIAFNRMTSAPLKVAIAIGLFAVHPLRVESVAWISERKDVLSMLFVAVALVAYEDYCRRPTLGRYAGVMAAMAAGLLAKASVVTLPVLLLLLDVWPMRRATVDGMEPRANDERRVAFAVRDWKGLIIEKLPLFLLSACFVAVTLWSQEAAIHEEESVPFLSVRLPNAVHATAWYVWATVWPFDLQPFYRHPGSVGWPAEAMAASLASLVTLGAVAWCTCRSIPAISVGVLWFLIALSPVVGLVAQVGNQAHADRYSYVPHVGLCLAIVWGAAAACQRAQLPSWAIAGSLFITFSVLMTADRRQITVWQNSETLWRYVLARDPGNPIACNNLGVALYESGRAEEALQFLERAVEGSASHPPYRANLEQVRRAVLRAKH